MGGMKGPGGRRRLLGPVSLAILVLGSGLEAEAGGGRSDPPAVLTPARPGARLRYESVFTSEAEGAAVKGEVVKEETASGGKAVFLATSKAYHPDTEVTWVTGSLERGFYRVRLRLRARGRSDDGLLGQVEVAAEAGESLAPSRPVHDFHHESSSGYFEVAAAFEVPHTAPLTVRFAHNGQTDVWIDSIRVERETSSAALFGENPPESAAARAAVSLNGPWEFQPVFGDLLYPPDEEWSPVPIRVPGAWNANSFARAFEEQGAYYPSYPAEWETAKAGWYRLRFVLEHGQPDGAAGGETGRIQLPLAGRRLLLRFDAVAHSAEVYVNGIAAGYHVGGFTPFEIDATDSLRPGEENTLLVGVRTWHHYHDRKKRRTFPTGSFWGEHAGGIWQSVMLESRPMVHVSDVFIQTSVRRGEIRATAWIRNDDVRDRFVTVSAGLVDEPTGSAPPEGGIPTFPAQRLHLSRAASTVAEWAAAWERPRLWSPEDPHLYTISVSAFTPDAEGASALSDTVTTRFGFREIWIDGRHLMFNGRRLKLRGDAWHFIGPPQMDPAYAREWYGLAKRWNLNTVRLHAQPFPEFYLDLADEAGMLITDETSWWASSGGYVYGEPFREQYSRQLEDLVRRDRNHPSVIIWSLANELVAGHSFYSDDGIRDPGELSEMVRECAATVRSLDPTRPISSDGDEDLGGAVDFLSLHYPYPDVQYASEKPVMIGEACPMYYAGPLEIDAFGGEDVFRDFEARGRAVAEATFWQLRNYRRWAEQVTPFNLVWYGLEPLAFRGGESPPGLRAAAPGLPDRFRPYASTLNPGWESDLPRYRPNRIADVLRDAMAPRRLFLARRGLRFYAPGRPEMPVLVFNDTPDDGSFLVRWELAAGGTSATREVPVEVPAGEFRRVEPNVPVPEVAEVAIARLRLRLAADGEVVHSATHLVYLYPRPERWPQVSGLSEKRIVIYAGADDLVEGLDSLRVGFERIYGISELDQVPCDLLIVGRSAAPADDAVLDLHKRLRRGLRVLFMEGNAPWLEAMHLARAEPYPYERVFPCRWDHPLFHEMGPWALEYWMAAVEDRTREDAIERLGDSALAAFQRGALRPLLFAAGGRAVVAEGREGKGYFVLNQMNVLRRLQDDPAALHFLTNLIRYAATAPQWDTRPAAMVGPPESRLVAFLRGVGLDAEGPLSPVDAFLAQGQGILLVDASVPDRAGAWPRVRRFVRQGGTAVLWGLTPDTVADWTGEVPGGAKLTGTDAEQLVKSVSDGGRIDPVLDGIRHATMYWVKGSFPTPILSHSLRFSEPAEVAPLLEVPAFDWRVWEENPEMTRTVMAHRNRGGERGERGYGLVRISMGEGALYLSQLPADLNQPRAVELARQFLVNLGAPVEREATAQQAAFNVDTEGFIRSWLLCGPFTAEATGSLLDVDFLGGESGAEPRPGKMEAGGRAWQPYYSPEPAVDFESPQVYGWTDRAAVYAAVFVYSPASPDEASAGSVSAGVDLLFGSDDGCTVWLNGERIYHEVIGRPLVVDNIRLKGVRFRRGWNLLLFKVEDQVWKWGLVARLADASGALPAGFLVSPERFPVE